MAISHFQVYMKRCSKNSQFTITSINDNAD